MPGTLNTQENINISLKTPLGENTLILESLEGEEHISRPFSFRLSMYAHSPSLDLSRLLGKEATVTFKIKGDVRYLHGIIGQVAQGPTVGHPTARESERTLKGAQVTYYTAFLYPSFWIEHFNQDCRIYQNQDTLKIVTELLKKNKKMRIKDLSHRLGRQVFEYCVRYNESTFNFVSRLLETAGIYYFFEQKHDEHTLILSDGESGSTYISGREIVPYIREKFTRHIPNAAFECYWTESTVPDAFSAGDFNYEIPHTRLFSESKGHGIGGEVYEYPGGFQKQSIAEKTTPLRIEERESLQKMLRGQSTVSSFAPGYKFKLRGHERKDINTTYIIHSVHHEASYEEEEGGFLYKNSFTAFPEKTRFRPDLRTPHPKIYGSQTAIVTGKKDEEIWTDSYSRIKVKFHWDRYGKDDETSSCWIRVSTAWAGAHWGTLYTPRIGQEVVVSFLNGDPNKPLVTGSVYNGVHKPPYRAEDPTIATMKSSTSKGGKGFNEIRFQDKKDHEELYVHAQKDMAIDIINNRTTKIEKGNCTTTIEAGDRTVTLTGKKKKDEDPGGPKKRGNDFLTLDTGSRTVKLLGKGSEEGSHTMDIAKGNHTLSIKKGNEIRTLTEGNQTIKLAKGNQTVTVNGSRTESITKDYTLTVKGNLIIDVTGNITLKAGQNLLVKAGQNITMDAGMSFIGKAATNVTFSGAVMALKATGTGIYEASGVLTLKGSLVTIV